MTMIPKQNANADGVSAQPAHNGLSISQRALRAVSVPYLEGLNAEQRSAVEAIDGPVLVLAGAGTGKTRVLTTRIAHILATGRARAHEILAVTFTNKAARELKERISRLVGGSVEGMPWLGTFHAIGVKILRRHAELADLKSGFTILDTDDQIRLLKQLLEADELDTKRWPPRHLANLIDGWKNRGLTPGEVPKGEGIPFGNGRGVALYTAYQVRLKELNAVDFGDLLIECLRLFKNHPDVLEQYQRRFRYILVDEYQDTNVAQYLWLRLLSQQPPGSPPPNIACVGDDDQSIYGWRGAEVDNILRFEVDFPGAVVVRLERNYRSTGHILGAASGLIAHNRGRLGKTLRTDDADGEPVVVEGVWDDSEEARRIGETIEELQRRGHKLDEVAILVRASFQMRAFEDRFITMGLPYRVIGGPRFYERQEIKDAIAYLELLVNPAHDLKFERIVNVPKRGLGDSTVQLIHNHARKRETFLLQAARELAQSNELKPKPRKTLTDLIANFDRWRSRLDDLPHTELAELVLDESGYTAMWQQDKSPQAHSRLENLKELVRFMADFENLGGFLEHVSLVMDAVSGDDGDRVNLMTLHGAKGLEFDTVFLPGWEEGLCPHQRSLDESGNAGLEEERRLAHVGLTRGRKLVHITFTQNRRVHALWQSAVPSRFIDELPMQHVRVVEATGPGAALGGYGRSRFEAPAAGFRNSYETPGWQRAQAQWAKDAQRTMQQQDGSGPASGFAGGSGFAGPMPGGARSARATPGRAPRTINGDLVASSSASVSAYTVGERVYHDKFGYGDVAEVDGNKLTVEFDQSGRKRVVDTFLARG